MSSRLLFILCVCLFGGCNSEPQIVISKEVSEKWHSPYSVLGNKYGEGYYYDECWLIVKSDTVMVNQELGTYTVENEIVKCYCADTAKWASGDTIKELNEYRIAIK